MGKTVANVVRIRKVQLAVEVLAPAYGLIAAQLAVLNRSFDKLVDQAVGGIEGRCCALRDIRHAVSTNFPKT